MLFLSLFYLFTHDIYYTSILVSLLLTIAAAFLLWTYIAETEVGAVFAVVAMLASKPFIDYATSGLENPLTYLLLAVFFLLYFHRKTEVKSTFWLAFAGSLVVLNRMDLALIVSPAVLYYLWENRSVRSMLGVLAGTWPFVAWEAFSVFYYGFPFPNTAYAKLSTGIARSDLVTQGWYYLQNGVEQSPFTIFVMAASIAYAVYRRSFKLIAPAIGILLYAGYIVRVGGDFMEGRFLAAPFLVGVILLSRHHFDLTYRESTMIAVSALSLGIFWPHSPIRANTNYGKGPELYYDLKGISDERAGYYQYTSPLLQDHTRPIPNHPWVLEGLKARADSTKLVWRGGIGFFGYFAGPHVHIVDKHALTEPLLARLPTVTPRKWRIGHFARIAPEGYRQTLESGKNEIVDSSLARYYDKLMLVTRGPLFSLSRLRAIWRFNTGQFNHLLREYLNQPQRVALRHFDTPRPEGTPYNAHGCILLSKSGLKVLVGEVTYAPRVEISADCNDEYILHFLRGTDDHGSVVIKPRRIPSGGLRVEVVDVPQEAVRLGYYYILIIPKDGDGTYSVGHVRLLND
jgi:arabinofuranosyltransferase